MSPAHGAPGVPPAAAVKAPAAGARSIPIVPAGTTVRETRTTCPYCGVGCGVIVAHDGTAITGVRGDPDHPANRGRLCTKGATLHLTASEPAARDARLLAPMCRANRGEAGRQIAWGDALDLAAARIAGVVREHGADALGIYVSGQLLTEDYYVFNKLARGLLGCHQIDSNSRLCMSSAVAGYKATLGADAPPACYEDIALAGTVFIAGSNMAWAHPVLMRRLEDARRANPAQRWIVVDPRRTETAAVADLHLQIAPGTDVALFHGMLHLMLWEGLVDAGFIARHTAGFDALRDRVREFTPRHVARLCGVAEEAIVQAARWFAGMDAESGADARSPTLSLYCQGLNQSTSGTDKNVALVGLHLATGQIGRPGAGPFSLTGQPNAMGGREVGALANLLPGHRNLADAGDRAELAALWGVPELPATPGRTALEMFEAAADGAVRLLWVVCTNPAQSLPDQAMVRRALQRAEFVIVQEAFANTATAGFADLLLPAASWGEKEGSVTNSERRISRVRAAVPPPGHARPDWSIARDVARRLERLLPPRRADGRSLFGFETVREVWEEHRATTQGRDLDISGLAWADLDTPRQWPVPAGAREGRARLYEDGRFPTPDGRARFAAPAWRPVAQPRDARHPFSLVSGRLRDQWHGMSRTGTLGRLFAHDAEPALELHPLAIQRRGWRPGDLVRVRSRQGELVLPVQASEALRPTDAHVAMHWGGEFLGGAAADGAPSGGVNALTTSARCPQSRQPELKHVAVRISPAELPWRMLGCAWLPPGQALAAREALRAQMPRFGFASCVPFGREPADRVGLLWRAAAREPVGEDVLVRIEAALGLDGAAALHYADKRRGQRRSAHFGTLPGGADDALLGFLMAGDLAAEPWAFALLRAGSAAVAHRHALLGARAAPLPPVVRASRQICNCVDVREDAIVAALASCLGDPVQRLAQLQQRLGCGTQCGSCLPALRELERSHAAGAGWPTGGAADPAEAASGIRNTRATA